MKKSIGILGGMGPMATADLFREIVSLTDAASDQDHIRIYIDNNTDIPDRTAALLAGGADPLPAMTDSLRKLEDCGADCIIMPCNTAHCFLKELQSRTKLPFLDMPKITAQSCRKKFPQKTAAILATRGTLQSGLYQDLLDEEGVSFLTPDEREQDVLMRVIYEGVKAGNEPELYRGWMCSVTDALAERGADYFILGCTELPIAAEKLGLAILTVNPTEELAKAAIRFCGYKVLQK